jgi:HrpA-like RNA helicase
VSAAADAARKAFEVEASDHLSTFNAIAAWRRIRAEHGRNFERQWCRKHFLSVETLCTIEDMASQFSRLLDNIGFIERSRRESSTNNLYSSNNRLVAAVLVAGLFPNVARVHRTPGTRKLSFHTGVGGGHCTAGQEVFVHPRSINHSATSLPAEWLVFHDKVRRPLPAGPHTRCDAWLSGHIQLMLGCRSSPHEFIYMTRRW